MRAILLFILCIPPNIIGWTVLLFMRVIAGKRFLVTHGVLAVELDRKSFFVRKFYTVATTEKAGWGATTFSPDAIMVNDGEADNEPLWYHELVHVEQFEQEAISALCIGGVLALLGWWWVGLIWWGVAGLFEMFTSYMTAFLRKEQNLYRGSHFEEAAYNVAACHYQKAS